MHVLWRLQPQPEYLAHMWGVSMNRALEHAAWSNALQTAVEEGSGNPLVLASCPSTATTSWFSHLPALPSTGAPDPFFNFLSANIHYTPALAILQPPMHAQSMIGRSQLPSVVALQLGGAAAHTNFSVVALASDDGKQVVIRAVNLNATAVTAAVTIADNDVGISGACTVLSGDLDAYNSPERPHNVEPVTHAVTAAQLTAGWVFPPHSFTVLNLSVASDYRDDTSDTSSVSSLIDRVVGSGASLAFLLTLDPTFACPESPTVKECVRLSDAAGGRIGIRGTSLASLTFGVGVYLRERCHATLTWVKTGGLVPRCEATALPPVGPAFTRGRAVRWTYVQLSRTPLVRSALQPSGFEL